MTKYFIVLIHKTLLHLLIGCLGARFSWPNDHCAVGEHGVVEAIQEHGLQLMEEVDVSDSWSVAAEDM